MDANFWLIISGLEATILFGVWWIGFHNGEKAALEKVRRALGASRVQYMSRECMPGHVVKGGGILVEFSEKNTRGCILSTNVPSPSNLDLLILARNNARGVIDQTDG